ncbi:MAG: SOS response-associated peptidase [Phycisphaeraceae bacterium]|nr:SOS response-associated peptidase [Phycisphaeraceae bacterium]
MCGRYTLVSDLNRLIREFGITGQMPRLEPRYNIAPSQPVPVVLMGEDRTISLRLMRWGLVPHWSKDVTMGNRLINARIETVFDKPAYRDPMQYRRCVLPADGFYEWRDSRPHHVARKTGRMIALAGVWDHWQDEHGNELETCAVLTTASTGLLQRIHPRMPVMLDPAATAGWLTAPSGRDALDYIHRQPALDDLHGFFVSTRVNAPTADGPSLIEPDDLGPMSLFE